MSDTVNVDELCELATRTAWDKGFHVFTPTFGVAGVDAQRLLALLMLVTTEVAEAAEEVRRGTSEEKFTEELADVCIRVFDLAGLLNLKLHATILEKMHTNLARPIRHGGKLA